MATVGVIFGHIPVLLKTCFLNYITDLDKNDRQVWLVLSQNTDMACILLNGHDLPCVVPVRCLTFCP